MEPNYVLVLTLIAILMATGIVVIIACHKYNQEEQIESIPDSYFAPLDDDNVDRD